VPMRKSQIFSTAADSQTQVQINVVQGERPMAADNKQLGTFNLDGIPPAPRGVPQIEVTFDIDADGILHVSAQDKATGREQKITITASSGLSQSEVERMVKEAEGHAAEDRARKEEVELRNQADTMAYQAEKTLRELGDKVPGDLKSQVEGKVKAVRDALNGTQVDAIRRASDELSQLLQQVGQQAYQQAGPTPQPEREAGGGSGGDDSTVDGEFREV
jgi:molecular chaperone DnaK